MRVAQVCPYSLSVAGGVQEQALGLARAMREEGCEVSVLAPCDGEVAAPDVIPLGRSVPLSANGSIAPVAPHPSSAWKTRGSLRRGDFDIVHVHEPLVPAPSLVSVLCASVPVVGTFHRAGAGPMYRLVGSLTKQVVQRLAVRCAVSPEARATARQVFGGDYELLFNGVDLDRFASAPPSPTEGPTILFVGRHEARKGLPVLLAVLDDLPTGTRVWIAGEGRETDRLRAETGGRSDVVWLGRVDDRELASRLRGADVLCAPSLGAESFGVVLAEAMAARTAIVASDIPGYREVARPGREALLVPPGDRAALAEALTTALTDPGRRGELVGAAAERVGRYSMRTLAGRYLELYRGLVGA